MYVKISVMIYQAQTVSNWSNVKYQKINVNKSKCLLQTTI